MLAAFFIGLRTMPDADPSLRWGRSQASAGGILAGARDPLAEARHRAGAAEVSGFGQDPAVRWPGCPGRCLTPIPRCDGGRSQASAGGSLAGVRDPPAEARHRAGAAEVSGFGQDPADRWPGRPGPMPDSDPSLRWRSESGIGLEDSCWRSRSAGRSQTPRWGSRGVWLRPGPADRWPGCPGPMPDSDPALRWRSESGIGLEDSCWRSRSAGRSQTPRWGSRGVWLRPGSRRSMARLSRADA